MGWSEADDKIKRSLDKKFLACTEGQEIDHIKKIIKDELPHLSENKIDAAIKSCCKIVPAPHPRDMIMQCLERKLVG